MALKLADHPHHKAPEVKPRIPAVTFTGAVVLSKPLPPTIRPSSRARRCHGAHSAQPRGWPDGGPPGSHVPTVTVSVPAPAPARVRVHVRG